MRDHQNTPFAASIIQFSSEQQLAGKTYIKEDTKDIYIKEDTKNIRSQNTFDRYTTSFCIELLRCINRRWAYSSMPLQPFFFTAR